MTIEEFNKRLEDAQLRKKDFARLTGLSYGSVTNWGQEKKPIPSWVDSWLSLYVQNKIVKSIIIQIQRSGLCEQNAFLSDE
jgi:DNA-binding transcriptional regulator YiaG